MVLGDIPEACACRNLVAFLPTEAATTIFLQVRHPATPSALRLNLIIDNDLDLPDFAGDRCTGRRNDDLVSRLGLSVLLRNPFVP